MESYFYREKLFSTFACYLFRTSYYQRTRSEDNDDDEQNLLKEEISLGLALISTGLIKTVYTSNFFTFGIRFSDHFRLKSFGPVEPNGSGIPLSFVKNLQDAPDLVNVYFGEEVVAKTNTLTNEYDSHIHGTDQFTSENVEVFINASHGLPLSTTLPVSQVKHRRFPHSLHVPKVCSESECPNATALLALNPPDDRLDHDSTLIFHIKFAVHDPVMTRYTF